MNRQQRRYAERQARRNKGNGQRPALPPATPEQQAMPVPDDIKTDIAKTVRSIDWGLIGGLEGGLCLFRNMTGWLVLGMLEIPAMPALGGMIYRAGPYEHRDVVAFCGPGNVGTVTPV